MSGLTLVFQKNTLFSAVTATCLVIRACRIRSNRLGKGPKHGRLALPHSSQ